MRYNVLLSFFLTFLLITGYELYGLGPAHLKGSYQTEHIAWATPSVGTPKKVLFFTYFTDGIGRYPQELAQRYPIEYEKAYFNIGTKGVPAFIGGEEGMSRAEELIRRGDWNAFVFWGCSPSALLEKNHKGYMLFLQQVVRNGAGVVVIDGNLDNKVLKEKNRLKEVKISLFRDQFPVEFYKIGKGRGVFFSNFDIKSLQMPNFRYQQSRAVPYSEGWRDRYEMRLGDIWSGLAWSMRLQESRSVLSVSGRTLSVIPGGDGTMTLFLRGNGERITLYSAIKVKKGEKLEYALPKILPGSYMIGAIIKEGGKVSSFGGMRHIVSENKSGKIQVLSLEKNFGKTGEKITGKVSYSGGKQITLRLRDFQRRILMEKKLSNEKFEFVLEPWMPFLLTVEATLSDGETDLDRKYVYCKKTIDRSNSFDMALWGYNEFSLASIDVDQRLYDLGCTELVSFAPKVSPVPIMYMPPYGGPLRIRNAHKEQECWRNPEFMMRKKKELSTALRHTAQAGMKRVLFGDEGPVQLGCLAPSCQKEYREFLQTKYKNDLSSLNRAWKSTYNAWDQVGVSMIPEKNEGRDLAKYGKQIYVTPDSSTRNHAINTWGVARPRDWNQLVTFWKSDKNARDYYNDQFLMQDCASMLSKNYTRWFDRCDYRSFAMAKTLKEMDTIVKDAFPGTATGMSGTYWLGLATDFDRIFDSTTCAMTYGRFNSNPMTELISSMVSPDYACNIWVGYAKTSEPMISATWSDILCHPSMFSVYSVFSSPPAYWGMIRPDLETNVPGQGLLDSTYKIRNGIGDTLIRSRKQFDEVAILWNWPSTWAARIEGGETFQLPENSYVGAIRMLCSLGIRYRFVTEKQLADGKADLGHFLYLFLPRIDAMSDKLADQIRTFARNGGRVIADVRPGVFGENLEMLSGGKLDKEFGIQRSAPGTMKSSNLNMSGIANAKFDLDSTVRLAGGKALFESQEKIPAWIENKFGKGKFLLLNFAFYNLPHLDEAFMSGTGNEFLKFFSKIKPVCSYSENGKKVYRYRNASWENGDMVFLFSHDSSINAPKRKIRAELKNDAKFVFDVNAGKSLGKVREFDFTASAPNPNIFILTEKALPSLSLQVHSHVTAGTKIEIGYCVKGSMKGYRPAVLTMEFDGKKVPGFRHVLLAEPEKKSVPYFVAFNELKGIYKLLLKDTLTNSVTTAIFEVK